MNAVDLLGWVAATLGTSTAFPQLWRLWRHRTSAGISILLWQFSVAGCTAWTAHGFMVQHPQLMWPNVILTTASVLVLFLVTRDRGLAFLPRLAWPVALGGVIFGIDLLAGAGVFGLVVATPSLVGMVNQLIVMRRTEDLSGISVAYLWLGAVMQVLWFTWGVLKVEWAITGCAALLGTIAVINLSYYLYRQARSGMGVVRDLSLEPAVS